MGAAKRSPNDEGGNFEGEVMVPVFSDRQESTDWQ